MVLSTPKRRAKIGANGERSAKASIGKVVSRPAPAFDSPRESRIEPSNGPTEVSGDRMVSEIRTMPMMIGQLDDNDFFTIVAFVSLCTLTAVSLL
ncbi:hypothetical protein D3C74_436010 [compost metagenome]